jgi:hypothetical protein
MVGEIEKISWNIVIYNSTELKGNIKNFGGQSFERKIIKPDNCQFWIMWSEERKCFAESVMLFEFERLSRSLPQMKGIKEKK